MNNNNSIKSSNKLRLNILEKTLYPFFNALPQDVPTEWVIPFLCIIEDLQYLQYIVNDKAFPTLRQYVLKLYTIFDPNIISSIQFYLTFGFIVLFTLYVYFVLIYHIRSNGRKTMSKKNLWIFNSLYTILFRYCLQFVLNFLFKPVYLLCQFNISGIPECDSVLNTVIKYIAIVTIVLITVYNVVYSNFNMNTNCLSSGKYFGSMHKANINGLLFTKLILACIAGFLFPYLMAKNVNDAIIAPLLYVFVCGVFSYLAVFQLKNQPYYSIYINNYRFAVYATIAIFQAISFIFHSIDIYKSQVVADIVPVIIIILFIVNFKLNDIYYKSILKRIYKKYYEKQVVSDLRESTSVDELKYSPEKLKKKSVYQSVERITTETYIKKEIKVFKNFYECEIACRFLRNNRNIEAYQLMRKLFEEGFNQFKHEANIYIMAWYYIHSMKKFYKENNLLKKYDMNLFNDEGILNNAMDLKLDMRKKYLINKAESYIEIEKRENSMNTNSLDVESSIKLEELKNNVVITHIQGLQEIKELFTKLRSSTNTKDISSYALNISNICKFQNSAYSQYNTIIRQFPDAKDVSKMYVLFLMDVMNKDDLAFKYANGNVKMLAEHNSVQASANEVTSPTSANEIASPTKINDVKDKKALTSSSNSLISIPHSDFSSQSGMGRELRKKINAKNSMAKKYLLPIKNLKLNMAIFIVLFMIFFAIQAIYSISIFRYVENRSDTLNLNMNIPGAIKTVALNVRLLSYNLILNNFTAYDKHMGLLKSSLMYLDTMNMESVSSEMDIETSDSLLEPVGEYAYDTFEKKTLADSYKKFISNIKFCINREPLKEDEPIYDILFEPHFKYFIINSKSNFDLVFSKCKEVISDQILNTFDNLDIIIISLEIALVFIILCIAYITFIPLNKSMNKILINSLRMFKYLSKENYETVITDYEEKIESLCQSFELDKEITEGHLKHGKTKTFKNIKLILSFAIIIIYVIIAGIPVLNVANEISNILTIMQKSSDRLALLKGIQLFSYEIINRDKSIFLDTEPERILTDLISKLETIQEELKTGSYGGPTFDSYPSLNNVLKENGCHRLDKAATYTNCTTIEYNPEYGFSKEVGTLPLNELIREYIYYVHNFLDDVKDGKYERPNFINKENIGIIFNNVLEGDFFKFQDGAMDNIFGDIQYIDQELLSQVSVLISNNSTVIILLISIGIVIFLAIDIFIFNKLYSDKIKEMNTLVSFLFLVPPSIVNKNEKFKRFLETTQTDD